MTAKCCRHVLAAKFNATRHSLRSASIASQSRQRSSALFPCSATSHALSSLHNSFANSANRLLAGTSSSLGCSWNFASRTARRSAIRYSGSFTTNMVACTSEWVTASVDHTDLATKSQRPEVDQLSWFAHLERDARARPKLNHVCSSSDVRWRTNEDAVEGLLGSQSLCRREHLITRIGADYS